MTWCYLHTLTETFQAFVKEFSLSELKFYGLLIPLFLALNDLKKRRCKQKYVCRKLRLHIYIYIYIYSHFSFLS